MLYLVDHTHTPDTVVFRFRSTVTNHKRIVFIPSPGYTSAAFTRFLQFMRGAKGHLSQPNMLHLLLIVAIVLFDPFPFGSGMTTLDGFAVCSPSVTLPAMQSVPALTAGMYRAMNMPEMISGQVFNIANTWQNVAKCNKTKNIP